MYKVFKEIPKEKRQQAFGLFLTQHSSAEPVSLLGALNHTLGITEDAVVHAFKGIDRCRLKRRFFGYPGRGPIDKSLARSEMNIPESGRVEAIILSAAGIQVNPKDADRFLRAESRQRFNDTRELAIALGLETHQENETPTEE